MAHKTAFAKNIEKATPGKAKNRTPKNKVTILTINYIKKLIEIY